MRQLSLLLAALFMFCWANAQYAINGSASVITPNVEYRLTPDAQSQGGSVWYQTRLDLRYDFSISTQVFLGTHNSPGADGIAFVLQPLSSGIGGVGGGLGYFGINPSLDVEFDTYQNGDRGDPADDHLGINKNGSVNHDANSLLAPFLLANIENGVYHTATFTWVASTKTFTVNFDGTPHPIVYDLIANIFGGSPYVYWGFTGGTGAESNDQRVRIGTINFVEEIQIPGVATNASCPNSASGAVDISPTGGITPYSYLWSNGATTQDLVNVGPGNYTVTVTDANGVSKSATFTVGSSPDVTPPTIVCPGTITVSNDPGICGAKVNFSLPTVTDNCGDLPTYFTGYTYKGTYNGHAYFLSNSFTDAHTANANAIALGGHLATISNAAENAFVASLTPALMWIGFSDEALEGTFVWVNGEPVTYTNWNPLEPNNLGNENWTVINWAPGTWNDWNFANISQYVVEFDGGYPITQTTGLPSGSTFPVGTTTNTFTTHDRSGNPATCSFTVTVTDDEAPNAKCKAATVTLSGGSASITVADVNDNSTDNCGIQSMSVSPNTFNCSNTGNNNVTLTVKDIYGHVSTCTAVVTVVGEVPTCSIASVPTDNTYTGGNPNVIYLGYGAQSTVLQVSAPAIGAPYTYSWSPVAGLNDPLSSAPTFTPTAPGNYVFTVTVTNKYGCSNTCTISICVLDVRVPGTDGKKVYVCHYTNGSNTSVTIAISTTAVSTHIFNPGHGDHLGTCEQSCGSLRPAGGVTTFPVTVVSEFDVKAMPNPSNGYFKLHIESNEASLVSIRVVDLMGRVVYSKKGIEPNSDLTIGNEFLTGAYFAQVVQGANVKTIKLVKVK